MDSDLHSPSFAPRPRLLAGLQRLLLEVGVFLSDALLVFYLWVIGSYCYSRIAFGEGTYFLVPGWVLLLCVVEGALLWETFGTSLAMRVSGVTLAARDGCPARLAGRLLRLVTWHVSFLPVVGLAASLQDPDHRMWHDRWSGTCLTRVEKTPRRIRWYRTSWGLATLLTFALTLVAGFLITKIDLHALFTGARNTAIVWRRLFRPDWSILSNGLGLLIVTLFMALMATLFGIAVSAPLSFLAARNLMRGAVGRSVYTVVRVVLSIIRSIEPIVWAIIFVVWVRLGAFPGVLALFVHSIADLTKLYSERLESIDPGPVEAITATGANRIQVIRYGIVPQIINPYLSFTLYRWDINVRMATIIGVVGGGGIGQNLFDYIRQWEWEQAGLLMLLI
ncbi:MAG: phosphonate ABC transporter, permease protein PhnE, partial [Candidatus Bipolaricaulota bacterium]|nr:phosphonate ABC transporter, permease protein PhnE [Candidatus Bipolaricaulota bacterium]